MKFRKTLAITLLTSLTLGMAPQALAGLDGDLAGVANAYAQEQKENARKAEAARRAAAARAAAARAKQEKIEAAKLADKKREQAYEDEKRSIELEAAKLNLLEEKKLELEMKKAKLKRADEFIDAELAREKASTDVIQSNADANRTISGHAREQLEKEEAKKEKEGKFLGIF